MNARTVVGRGRGDPHPRFGVAKQIEEKLIELANGANAQSVFRQIAAIADGQGGEVSTRADKEIRSWPAPPERAAFAGLAGEIVHAIERHSEADPIALLAQFLVAFGCVAGRSPHFLVDGAPHYTNENVIAVGATSSGRKGTSWTHVRNLFRRADEQWTSGQILSGLSSGEGLIYAVRDPIPPNEDGKGGDPGAPDKRVLIVETEFAAALKVMRRDGNTLSEIVRQAWDSGTLRTLTRAAPLRATDAHIAIIGHVTPPELRKLLDEVSVANGLLNRFMLIAVRRSKYLPDGGAPAEGDMEFLARNLNAAMASARIVRRMDRDEQARALWFEVYQGLADRPGGLLGAATSRAAAHVVRLSCLYALLDRSTVITRAHLESALAFWRYVEDSTRFLLGDSLGDPVADVIRDALVEAGDDGMTRSAISALRGGHWLADEIDSALQRLATDGLAICERVRTAGRSKEVWKSAQAKKAKEATKEQSGEDSSLYSLLSPNGSTPMPDLGEAWEPDPTQAEVWPDE